MLLVTILFHKNGLWWYPARSFFCLYISPQQFVVCFGWSRSMALTIFRALLQQLACCQPFFLALRMFESVLGVFGGCWMFVTCEKCWIFAFLVFAFFRNYSAFSCASLPWCGFSPNWRQESLVPWLYEHFQCILPKLDRCSTFYRLRVPNFRP